MYRMNEELEELKKELLKALDELKEETKEAKKDTIGDKIRKAERENLPKEALYEMLTKDECIELLEQSAKDTMKLNLNIAFLMTKLDMREAIVHPMQDEYKIAAARVMSGKLPESRLINQNNLIIKL